MNIEMSLIMQKALSAMNESLGNMYLSCEQEGRKVVVCDKSRKPVLVSPQKYVKYAISRKRKFYHPWQNS